MWLTTTVHNEFRAGDEGAIARCQKDRRLADVISSSQTAQGRFTGEEALLFAVEQPVQSGRVGVTGT